MARLVHLSDLHFGRIDNGLVADVFDSVTALAPRLVVISGDLTQAGRRREFAEARDFIAQLRCPVLTVPGNHDMPVYNLWGRFTDPLGRFRRYIEADRTPVYSDNDIAVIGLNSARPFLAHWNWSHGSLTRRQMARVVRISRDLPNTLCKAVVTHHPFLNPPGVPPMRLIGRARRALEIFASAGIELVLAGHLHRPAHGHAGPPSEAGAGPLLVHAGTTASTRTRGVSGNSFNSIDIGPDDICVREHRHDGRAFVEQARADYLRSKRPGSTAVTEIDKGIANNGRR